jgi:DNA-binding beta-propeller fold protein YncE
MLLSPVAIVSGTIQPETRRLVNAMRTNLYVTDLFNNLYTLDPATGSAGLIGSTSGTEIFDIAFHGPTLYAFSPTTNKLLRLDSDTGAVVWTAPNSSGFGGNGLAVAEDGTIYASGGGQLASINPVSGLATVVGAFGGGLISAGDIEFDANGNLYGSLDSSSGSSVLAKISRTTGVAAPIGPIGVPEVWGLAIHCCMFFGCTGTGELISINAATGLGTVIGTNGIQMGGMAARSCCC